MISLKVAGNQDLVKLLETLREANVTKFLMEGGKLEIHFAEPGYSLTNVPFVGEPLPVTSTAKPTDQELFYSSE